MYFEGLSTPLLLYAKDDTLKDSWGGNPNLIIAYLRFFILVQIHQNSHCPHQLHRLHNFSLRRSFKFVLNQMTNLLKVIIVIVFKFLFWGIWMKNIYESENFHNFLLYSLSFIIFEDFFF